MRRLACLLMFALSSATHAQSRVEVRVGIDEGDLRGSDHRVLQAAVDYVAGLGGGVVHVGPGRYTFRNALALRSNVHVRGTAGKTVFAACDGQQVRLTADAKAGAREIRLAEAQADAGAGGGAGAGLRVGDGIVIRDSGASGFAITTTTLVERIDGNTYRLSEPLVRDYATDRNATATLAFPVVAGWNVKDVVLENVTIEGNRGKAAATMDGCRAAGIYFYTCEKVTIRNCSVRDYRGDGISVQWKSKVVLVEDCQVENNAVFGLHPGSDSTACVFRRNQSLGNGGPGLFVCVAVRNCRFEQNVLRNNAGEGISIGERDADNVFRANEIVGNGRAGVLFRGDTKGDELEPHRNVFEKNTILDNGTPAAVLVRGAPRGLVFRDNLLGFAEAREGAVGFTHGKAVSELTLDANRYQHVTRTREVEVRD
jgi:parallel beta-helix repeat protein